MAFLHSMVLVLYGGKLVRAVIYTENTENTEDIVLTRVGEADRESYGVRESQDEL